MRALGLLDHRVDLLEVVNDLQGGGVIGLYDEEDKRIRMRGEDLTPAVKATLVHELTHALQDQHYDLEGRSEELDDDDDASSELWRRWSRATPTGSRGLRRRPVGGGEAGAGRGARARASALERLKDVRLSADRAESWYAFGEMLLALAIELEGNEPWTSCSTTHR